MAKATSPGPLERYVRILEVLAAYRGGLQAAELALILDLPKTTLNRLLRALEASGLVMTVGKRNSTYFIGSRLNKVLHSETSWIEIATERRLAKLASDIGETCFLTRMFDSQIECVAMQSPDAAAIGIYVAPGMQLPWHATASGKLLMALSGKPFPTEELERYSETTIVDVKALSEQFEHIRSNGYATEVGETVNGLATIAVPIPSNGQDDASYALGVTGIVTRIMDRKEEILPLLALAAPQIAAIVHRQNGTAG